MTWPGPKPRPLDPEYCAVAFQPLFPPQQTLKPLSILKNVSNNINPLLLNISIHILHTPLYAFPLILTRRICLTIKTSLVGDHSFVSHDPNE